MNLDLWFPTPIWSSELSINLEKPISKCLELETKLTSVKRSNVGGFQSDLIDWGTHKEFLECKEVIVNNLQKIIEEIKIGSVRLTSFWININRKGNFNKQHFHPQSFLSGCLYLKTPINSGKIIFKRPDIMQHYASHLENPIFFLECFYDPCPGMLLLFPSWVGHYVEPNNSDEPRISISFNIERLTS